MASGSAGLWVSVELVGIAPEPLVRAPVAAEVLAADRAELAAEPVALTDGGLSRLRQPAATVGSAVTVGSKVKVTTVLASQAATAWVALW